MASRHRSISRARARKGTSLLSKTIRWIATPCLGVVLFLWFAATFASLHSAKSDASADDFVTITRPVHQIGETAAPTWRQAAIDAGKQRTQPAAPVAAEARPVAVKPQPAVAKAVVAAVDPFDKAITRAALSHDKLLAAFAEAGMAVEIAAAKIEAPKIEAPKIAALDLAMPSAVRFQSEGHAATEATAAGGANSIFDPDAPLTLGPIGFSADLAYASVEAGGTNLLEVAIATMESGPIDAGVAVALAEPTKPGQAAPRTDREVAQRVERQAVVPLSRRERGSSPIRSQRAEPADGKASAAPERQEALAYVRPDKPNNAFSNLFNDKPGVGNKVAIYDISAAVVYMPDGSKLEAHSGIGKMADDPRYVNVKMNGPTPPNTYRLSMREKRFYGVEAVRMTPIGDQTMHGRDGILAHSYLLKGGRQESHGCVAFENYDRFLRAFKQGKVTHLIVVPSMSKLTKAHFAPIRGA